MRLPTCDVIEETDGFTLVELLVATILSLIVVGGAVMAFTSAIHSQPRIDSQATAIQQARTTVERIVRELRQGSSVPSAASSQLSIVTYVHTTCGGASATRAMQCRVTYACSSGICTRGLANPNGTSPTAPVRLVSGLSSDNVFSYSPSATTPTWVGVTLSFPAQTGHNAITLTDGAALRNRSP